MKVLHIITGLPTAGAQMALYRLLANTDRKRFDCSVISLMDRGPVGEKIERLGIPVLCANMKRGIPTLASAKVFLRLIRSMPAPDVIQGWEYHGNVAASLARLILSGKSVLLWNIRHTPYKLSDERWSTAAIILLGRFLSVPAKKIIYNAEAARFAHERFGYAKYKGIVLPNGIDPDEFRSSAQTRLQLRARIGIAPDAFLVGMIARFHPMKDHATFFEAAGLLAQKYPDVRFLLSGEDVDVHNAAMREFRTKNGLAEKICLLGERRDMPDLLAALDVLTVPSAWGEGFPNIVGEAMSCGVPCVVTEVGDSARIVGETGIVIPPRHPEAMSKAWERILSLTGQERNELGLAARSRVKENYSLHTMIRNYENLYAGIFNNNL